MEGGISGFMAFSFCFARIYCRSNNSFDISTMQTEGGIED